MLPLDHNMTQLRRPMAQRNFYRYVRTPWIYFDIAEPELPATPQLVCEAIYHRYPPSVRAPSNKFEHLRVTSTLQSYSSYETMSALTMRMPPHLQSTATLATQVVDAQAPPWAASRAAVALSRHGVPEDVMAGARVSERDIFRLPNSSQAVRDWVYTRPDVEAVDEEAFENCAIESSTIFRIENFSADDSSIEIAPTVSNHWLLVPIQSINGVTVGVTYIDVLYQREDARNCVPPLRVGKFALEDSTGEVFVTGWSDSTMIVGWLQSVIKCERVRELLMYQAPPANGIRPRKLLLRNSFFERRDCRLCGTGRSFYNLEAPCSGIRNGIAHDVPSSKPLSNVASMYRRFRGGYYGVVLKTAYEVCGDVSEETIVPVFIDIKHGLHSVKQRFRNSLQRNCDFALSGVFGLHPQSSSRVYFLKTSAPVTSMMQICDMETTKKRKAPSDAYGDDNGTRFTFDKDLRRSPVSVTDCDSSTISSDRSASPPARRRRRVGIDEVDRESIEFERKRRNRIAAEKSNKMRKEKLERERKELRTLKERRKQLEQRLDELITENFSLKLQMETLRHA